MDARNKIIEIFLKHTPKYGLPSCGESLFQCDWYGEAALSILDDICEEFQIYTPEEDEE